jgi:uncharacterized protein (DUF2384 family)
MAAAKMGIPIQTFNGWSVRGKKELRDHAAGRRKTLTIKADLVQARDAAEARCHEKILLDVVTSDSIQAKQWFLERRWNKLYSRNPNARIDDETGAEVKVDALDLLAEKLRGLMEDG